LKSMHLFLVSQLFTRTCNLWYNVRDVTIIYDVASRGETDLFYDLFFGLTGSSMVEPAPSASLHYFISTFGVK
jgi:hypothetical protein